MTIAVGVLGAAGRMGRAVCDAVVADSDVTLLGGVDPSAAGETVAGVSLVAEPADLGDVDVVVDFTHLDAARANLRWAAEAGVHAVVGTTGFTDDDLARFRAEFTESNLLIAPNFAIGAVLMMRFAELAAPHFDSAEIIELHHETKLDAPSGTAMRTAEAMAAASDSWTEDPTRTTVVEGARGGSGPGGITMHSVRLRGLVAHQEVLLGTTGQTLTIRHDSIDRTSFMPGVLLAVRSIADLPGVTLGLEGLLGL